MKDTDLPASSDALLDAWSGHDWRDGVQIDRLRELDCVTVRTRNSTYHIVVTDPSAGQVLVCGGARFPAFTRARLCGSSAGGSILKCAGIYPGWRLELEIDGRRLLTSPVVAIDLEPPATEQ